MSRTKHHKTEQEKIEAKLKEIETGKWKETPERIRLLEHRLAELKKIVI